MKSEWRWPRVAVRVPTDSKKEWLAAEKDAAVLVCKEVLGAKEAGVLEGKNEDFTSGGTRVGRIAEGGGRSR